EAEDANLTLLQPSSGAWGRPADFDGDGILDVVADQGGPLLLRGRVPWPDTSVTGLDRLGSWSVPTNGFHVAGDFDGDGWTDLVAASPEVGAEEYREGGVHVLLGPPSRWGSERADLREAADVSWTHESITEAVFSRADAADLTGDGRAELIVLTGRDPEFPSAPEGYVRILQGRTVESLSTAVLQDEEPWFTVHWETGSYGNNLATLPDLDGDGLAELAIRAPARDDDGLQADTVALLPPDAVDPSLTGQAIADVWALLPRGDAVQNVELMPGANSLGDADGDGYLDAAVTVYDTDATFGVETLCTAVLRGAATLATSTVSDRLGGRVCFLRDHAGRVNLDPGYRRVVADIDADDVGDVYWSSVWTDWQVYDSDRMACVMPTAELPTSGEDLVQDARKFCFGTGTAETFSRTDVADLDGDGLPELLAAEPTWGDAGEGRLLVVPGFALPWDDPSRW
ncbi:MAG: FG-GAP repeat domain-containing protein, partial [Myxococcota bacterium]